MTTRAHLEHPVGDFRLVLLDAVASSAVAPTVTTGPALQRVTARKQVAKDPLKSGLSLGNHLVHSIGVLCVCVCSL